MPATAQEIQTALANDARRQELRLKISRLRGILEASMSVIQQTSATNNDVSTQIAVAQQQLEDIEAGSGPGVTADFGAKSTVTQLLEQERTAAKSIVIDFVKGNPTCTEEEAAGVWDEGAAASHPSIPFAIQNGLAMGRLYRANLFQLLYINQSTWEAQRSWIIATPKETIMVA